jgi:3'-phosphoadenosine 5'-phosphosulfate sulfotransferase (PAPS reductase)/FAD synthetase
MVDRVSSVPLQDYKAGLSAHDDTIWIYGASLTQQFERASIQFRLTREIFPSGFGCYCRPIALER